MLMPSMPLGAGRIIVPIHLKLFESDCERGVLSVCNLCTSMVCVMCYRKSLQKLLTKLHKFGVLRSDVAKQRYM
jgi:hypothetical protein